WESLLDHDEPTLTRVLDRLFGVGVDLCDQPMPEAVLFLRGPRSAPQRSGPCGPRWARTRARGPAILKVCELPCPNNHELQSSPVPPTGSAARPPRPSARRAITSSAGISTRPTARRSSTLSTR